MYRSLLDDEEIYERMFNIKLGSLIFKDEERPNISVHNCTSYTYTSLVHSHYPRELITGGVSLVDVTITKVTL